MSLFYFDKTGFKSKKEIESLYDKKIKIFLEGRDESELSEAELNILNRLLRAKEVDPRYLGTCFGLEDEASIGVNIANRLHIMGDAEFLISSYPYIWEDELPQKTICYVNDLN